MKREKQTGKQTVVWLCIGRGYTELHACDGECQEQVLESSQQNINCCLDGGIWVIVYFHSLA